jgi:hypothetical protein
MLKLASLAPELIALLAENTLDVEQCQALSLESDPARQVEVYQRVKAQHSYAPAHAETRHHGHRNIGSRRPLYVCRARSV